jgi:putative ABC transport system permease protein
VISDIAAVNCYGSVDDAIGRTFILQNEKNTIEASVVGVYKYIDTKGKTEKGDQRDLVSDIYCPYEFVNGCLGVNESELFYYHLTIIVDDIEKTGRAVFKLDELMEKRCDDEGYSANTFLGFNDTDSIKKTIRTVTLVFICAAALSLLSGGINLMNTLLVTVKERTREIGIKKAIGASNSRIVFQFLFESLIICLTACFIGIILSILAVFVLRQNLQPFISLISDEGLRTFLMTNGIEITIDFSSVITAIVFSLVVSQIFGIYPAIKASRMQVTDALRYE